MNKYILLSEVQELNAGESSLLSAVKRWCIQLVQPWRAAAAPSSAVRVGDERLHPSDEVRSATWADR